MASPLRSILAACVLVTAGMAAARAQGVGVPLVDAVPSITVEGTAKQDVRPDLAVVTLGVTTDRPTASDAAGENARAAAAVVAAARGAGLADADIQTSQLRLAAVLDQHDSSKTRAFRASNQITLRIHDLDRVGAIVGQLVAQGANTIEDIAFQVADPTPLLDDLRSKAVEDARNKARIYAQAAGQTLGRVIRISPLAGAPIQPARAYRMLAAAAPSAPPVEAGSETLETHVQITWELTPAAAPKP